MTPQEQDQEDEEKVFEVINANDGLYTLTDLEKASGVPWKGGRLSNALYGLDQIQGRIRQSTQDLFTCKFHIVK